MSIAVNPANPATLYAGAFGGGVFRSLNGAGTWQPMNTGLTDLNVQALVIDRIHPHNLYAGTSGGLFKSVDGGANWTTVNVGLTNLDVLALAIDPSTTSTLYAGTNSGGLFKSADSGATWVPSNTGIPSARIIHVIAIDSANPSTVYAGKASVGLVFKSTDAGESWSNVSGGLPIFPTLLSALAIDPSAPSRIYAGTDSSGAFVSAVGGGAWQPTGSVNLLRGTTEILLADGVLTSEQAGSLIDKLDAAVRSLQRSRTNAACAQLGAFINQVNAAINDGTLSENIGQALIDAAEALRSQIGCWARHPNRN